MRNLSGSLCLATAPSPATRVCQDSDARKAPVTNRTPPLTVRLSARPNAYLDDEHGDRTNRYGDAVSGQNSL